MVHSFYALCRMVMLPMTLGDPYPLPNHPNFYIFLQLLARFYLLQFRSFALSYFTPHWTSSSLVLTTRKPALRRHGSSGSWVSRDNRRTWLMWFTQKWQVA